MKVLWFGHRDIRHPRAGGAERSIYEICRRLVSYNNEVHLLAGGWKGAARHELIDGIHVHRYGSRVMPHLVHPSFLAYHSDSDVIVDDMAHAAPWFSPWFSSRPGAVFFRHLHARTLRGQTGPFLSHLLSFMESKYPVIYRKWPFVTESSSSMRDLMTIGVQRERIMRIPPGVNTDLFRPCMKSDTPSIIYFGGMRPYKRPEHVLIALKLLHSTGCRAAVTIVGEGPSLTLLKYLARSMNILDYVNFKGRLNSEELAFLVGSAWVNVHCSMSEGWGYSPMEAASAGTPTVAYSVPGIVETVKDGHTGLLVDDGNVTELAKALALAIERHSSFSKECIEYAKNYSWDRTAQRWNDLLSSLA